MKTLLFRRCAKSNALRLVTCKLPAAIVAKNKKKPPKHGKTYVPLRGVHVDCADAKGAGEGSGLP